MEQMSLQRKRFTGTIAGTDNSREREEREKRRKKVLEERIRQREEEERQRQERAKTAQERRRRERIETERAGEAARKQSATSRNTGIRVTNRAGTKPPAAKPLARSTPASRDSVLEVSPKRPKTQVLSYDQLMSIASGKSAAPIKTSSRSQVVTTPTTSSVRRQTGRSRSPVRTSRPRSPSDGKRKLSAMTKDAFGTQSKRPALKAASQTERVPSRTSVIDGRRETAGRKSGPISSVSREHVRQNETTPLMRKPPATTTTAAGTKLKPKPQTASAARQQPPAVRRPPEREIDRFGVCPGGRNASSSGRREPTGRTDSASAVQRRRNHPSAVSRESSTRDSRDNRNRPGAVSRPPRDTSLQSGSQSSRQSVSRQRDTYRNGADDRARGGAMSRSARPTSNGANHRHRNERHYEDDDDESDYDSLDDFVVDDDEEEGGGRYRAGSIREMFGVRYRDIDDDDDDDMEVSATQLMREDRI
ncbi:hypothetical protein GGI05_006102, partial [Coemansia sp. RSA 2603]